MNKLSVRTSSFLLGLVSLLFVFVASSSEVFAQDGEKLFKSYCAACHSSGTAQLVGPGLAGATERHDKEWLHKWVKDSQALIKSGDDKAVSLYEEYNKIMMPAQPVTGEEIDAIFAWVDENAAAVSTEVEDSAQQGGVTSTVELENESDHSLYIVLASILGLLLIISILRSVQYSLSIAESRKSGEESPVHLSMWEALSGWVQHNKTIVALIGIVLFIFIGKLAWNAMFEVGVYTNYEPEQPIKFSHKLHAGDNGIDCQYCHSTASFSKTAGIPPASTCMNCHTYISEGPQYGKEEIAKIYAALDFDPATKTYGPNKKPIKWVKVHNLPDHVYFNHSQHVVVGKIACQKCHGPVETFTVGKQFAPLTMGWCIDCHKTTKVQMEGSGYYDEIHKRLPEKLREQYLKDGTITVSELGGIECAKCHY